MGKELTLSYTYSEGQFLPPEDPETRDAAVIVGAKQDDAGKSILPQFVQALEHAWMFEKLSTFN